MSVKCLGKPRIPQDITIVFSLERPGGQNPEKKTGSTIKTEKCLELDGNRYLPLKGANERDKIEQNCVNAIKRSKKEPQPLVETTSKARNERTFMRLWLYEGKIYEVDRNDYDKQQVKLLILEFLDKEKKKFQGLEQKYGLGKRKDPSELADKPTK
jgi:hypothetical protein